MFIGWSSTSVFGADLKSNMAARVHNVFSLAEILKIFLKIKKMGNMYPTNRTGVNTGPHKL
jgi:hypothetical protein